MSDALPDGYVRVAAGRCSVITLEEHVADARALLADGSLYEAAGRDLAARSLVGRGIAYAIALPVSGTRAVVRRNRHGGLFAPLTRDLFLPPTRAPHELAVSLRLRAAGVRTPQLLMYGIERRAFLLRRSDVMTRAVDEARDLSAFMQPGEPAHARAAAWRAARALVETLDAAGARHHDLNVKNVLVARSGEGVAAWVLDVDRVEFTDPASARAGNRARLLRSARKWRDERGATFAEGVDYGD